MTKQRQISSGPREGKTRQEEGRKETQGNFWEVTGLVHQIIQGFQFITWPF